MMELAFVSSVYHFWKCFWPIFKFCTFGLFLHCEKAFFKKIPPWEGVEGGGGFSKQIGSCLDIVETRAPFEKMEDFRYRKDGLPFNTVWLCLQVKLSANEPITLPGTYYGYESVT